MTKSFVLSHEIMPVVKEILLNNQPVELKISGQSMRPFYHHQKTIVLLEKPKVLKHLDVVLYETSSQYKIHRIIKIMPDYYVINGDGLRFKENIREDQIFGVVIRHKTHQKWVNSHQFLYILKVKLWSLLRPFRRFLIRR
ncbi:MAG: hypothetical protein ACNA7K_06435 [Acholeplasmataceae bacterium]